jgi:antibiotic biosynthesis monooxygenase (ABM) superfamily enzyme
MTSGSKRGEPSPADGVTIVTQTRVRPGDEDAFARWQTGTSETIARFPGFIQQTVMPPSPPAQLDWVILQRFTRTEAATAWLNSTERLERVASAQPMLIGRDDVHLVADGGPGVLPAPVSVVIATRIKPGSEAAYRAWEQRIAAAQSKAPGFQGYRFEPPLPGVQEDWLAILRFDSEANLQAWLDSPERRKLLEEAKPFTEEFHARIARSGFDQWFKFPTGQAPAVWKQNMLLLLMLYPVVFLFSYFVQTPVLLQRVGLSFAVALFVGNVVSTLLLNYLVPWISDRFSWWLQPAGGNTRRIDIAGATLVIALYAGLVIVFSRLF